MFAKVRFSFIGIFFVFGAFLLGAGPTAVADFSEPTKMTLKADEPMVVEFYVKGYYDGRVKLDKTASITFPFPDRDLDIEWRFYNPFNNFHICSVMIPSDKEGTIHLTKDRCQWHEAE